MLEVIANKQSEENKKYNEEWLKTFKGFENYSKEQAEKELNSLIEFAEILCQQLLNTS